ncbi:hypothetical protein SPSYN_01088 [Sporotomaculum syntrophicum]|uniref:Uncharacterized protein n=1 Tax=Sporotomaculum syntrophicum TaxID=182264 RepID=A0A9D2WQW4_9FIRM|nr:hypothetical protein [Sporotomaculum syntrophicum]KAF1084952.1 hypothetical protein SPSYN_01088 [Sporotomaculum syntrophicum]
MKPGQHLEYYTRLYPAAWQQVDELRAARGLSWPEWCFMPLAAAYAIVEAEAGGQGIDITGCAGYALQNDAGIIGALAAWRETRGVYRFDPGVYRAVLSTPIPGELPSDSLFNLPEWGVYLETPGLRCDGRALAGFFACLVYDSAAGCSELWLVLDYDIPLPSLYTVSISLEYRSLAEALAKAAGAAARQADLLNLEAPTPAVGSRPEGFSPLVALLLYLCAVNADIDSAGSVPDRLQAGPPGQPRQPRLWTVGSKLDAALRGTAAGRCGPGQQQRGPRWQGYWTGRDTGAQKYVVKWLPPG